MSNKDWTENIPPHGVLCKWNEPGFSVIQICKVVDGRCFGSDGVDIGPVDVFTPLTAQELWLFMTWQHMEDVPKGDKSVLVKLEKEIRGTHTRYHTGTFGDNISIIAGRMGFDCSKPMGWIELPVTQSETE